MVLFFKNFKTRKQNQTVEDPNALDLSFDLGANVKKSDQGLNLSC